MQLFLNKLNKFSKVSNKANEKKSNHEKFSEIGDDRNKGCIIKNPFEDHEKYITEIDWNLIAMNNPFNGPTVFKTNNIERKMFNISNHKEKEINHEKTFETKILTKNVSKNKLKSPLVKENSLPLVLGTLDSLIGKL